MDTRLELLYEWRYNSQMSILIPSERRYHNCMMALDLFDGGVHISSLRALYPRSGDGTKAMKALCILADKYQVNLNLEADPFKGVDGRFIPKRKLLEWYAGFGFERRNPHTHSMYRVMYTNEYVPMVRRVTAPQARIE